MNFIKEIHSENGKWSSKRVYGGILLLSVCVVAFIKPNQALLEAMLYAGVALIGLGTVSKIAEAIKGKQP